MKEEEKVKASLEVPGPLSKDTDGFTPVTGVSFDPNNTTATGSTMTGPRLRQRRQVPTT